MNDQPQQLALSNQEAISRSQQSTTNQETNQETSQVTSQETSQETNQETTSQSQSDTMADSQIDPQDDESAYNFADVSQYEKISKIGQGTFGEVFKARHKTTRRIVALKRVLMENEKEGFPITALREIKILQQLKHENVVGLLEICGAKENEDRATFYLVFEFCDHDLAGLLSNMNVRFSLSEIKMLMKQLLDGLFFIHHNKILHRDLKTANILITRKGELKLADFGLARAFSITNKPNKYTNRVVTLWYRPPELLLGERNYGPPIDLWGAGCIMAELWTRNPILQGASEQHQLRLISELCGALTPDQWPGIERLELYNKLQPQLYGNSGPANRPRRKVRERLGAYVKDHLALDLLDKLLTVDPSKRIDAHNALDHNFFWSPPSPTNFSQTLSLHRSSMFEYLLQPKRRADPMPKQWPNLVPGCSRSNKPNAGDGQYHDRVF